MILFPAVDIKGGKAVRLRQGRADEMTVFSNDPVAMALHWESEGARFLHLVDLDGAFGDGEISPNIQIVRSICEAVRIPVQLGGGIRTEEAACSWLDSGVARVVIGTMAIEQPDAFRKLCRAYPARVGISLDADNGVLKTRGWVSETTQTVDDILPRLASDGAAFVVYTDIQRDGMKTGVNLEALERLASISLVPIIAAGGVASIDDIKKLYTLSVRGNLQGAISGQAIYEGSLILRDVETWIENQNRLVEDGCWGD